VQKSGSPLSLDLRLGANTDEADQIFGHVTDGTWVATLSGDRAVFSSKTNQAPYAGSFTMLVPGQNGDVSVPTGSGFGSVRVDASGRARFVGTLADGTKVSQSAPLSKQGKWPFYASLYSGNGLVLSWFSFTNQASSDFDGLMSWIKLPNAKARYYFNGLTNDCAVVGSAYHAPVGVNVLNLTSAKLRFCGGNLVCDFTNSVTVGPNSKVTDSDDGNLAMSFSLSTGIFRGNAADPSTGKSLPFGGAVLQKLDAGYGFLLGTNQSSQVVFEP
jgi:hypothetical protein